MSAVDWSQCPAVEQIPGRCSGAVTLKDSRSMLSIVFSAIGKAGLDAVCYQYNLSDEEREHIEEVLEFLEKSCEPEYLP
jgi:hypothetical protein